MSIVVDIVIALSKDSASVGSIDIDVSHLRLNHEVNDMKAQIMSYNFIQKKSCPIIGFEYPHLWACLTFTRIIWTNLSRILLVYMNNFNNYFLSH